VLPIHLEELGTTAIAKIAVVLPAVNNAPALSLMLPLVNQLL